MPALVDSDDCIELCQCLGIHCSIIERGDPLMTLFNRLRIPRFNITFSQISYTVSTFNDLTLAKLSNLIKINVHLLYIFCSFMICKGMWLDLLAVKFQKLT